MGADMTGRIPKRAAKLAAAILAATAVVAVAAVGTASAAVVFDDGPTPTPRNTFSLPLYETGYNITEFGAQVQLTGASTTPTQVRVLMSSFACGNMQEGTTCKTTTPKTYTRPITLNIYKVQGTGPGEEPITTAENEPGKLITTVTKTATVPFRPSASNKCPLEYQSATEEHVVGWSTECAKGKAFYVKYSKAELGKIRLPEKVIISVAYDGITGREGRDLHVAVTVPAAFATPSVGGLPLQLPAANEELYLNSPTCAAYAEPTPPSCKQNTFSLASQWFYQPVFKVTGIPNS